MQAGKIFTERWAASVWAGSDRQETPCRVCQLRFLTAEDSRMSFHVMILFDKKIQDIFWMWT